MDIMPQRYIAVSYDLDADLSRSGQGRAQALYMTYDSGSGSLARLSYQQIPELTVNEIILQANIRAYQDIYLETYHDYSLEGGLMFTQGYGIRYIRGCWGLGGGYERVGSDNRFVFTIDLLGFGSVGEGGGFFVGRPLFGESLPGYQHPETWSLFEVAMGQLVLPAALLLQLLASGFTRRFYLTRTAYICIIYGLG